MGKKSREPIEGVRERGVKTERRRGREGRRVKKEKDKVLLHHVFIRFDLGSHRAGGTLEYRHTVHKLKVNVRSIRHAGLFTLPFPAGATRRPGSYAA